MPRPHSSDVHTWLAEDRPLVVLPFEDELVGALGFHPASNYAELYWLPIVGPSALWALRRLVMRLELQPQGFVLDLAPMAAELGLGRGTGRNSPIIRTMGRLITFDLAVRHVDTIRVQTAVPPLARRHVERLPMHLVDLMNRTTAGGAPRCRSTENDGPGGSSAGYGSAGRGSPALPSPSRLAAREARA